MTLSGATKVTEVVGHALTELTWQPTDFGLAESGKESMLVNDPQASAAMIREVLSGKAGASRDIVVMNAAAALWTVGVDESLSACAVKTAEAIDSGAANSLLAKLAEASHV